MTLQTANIDRRDALLLITLSVLWGTGFVFAGIALKDLPPLTVVAARVALGAVFLLPLFWLRGARLPADGRMWWSFLGMGMLNNVIPFSLLILGQAYTTSALASIVNATTPLFTVLVTAAFGEERLSARKLAGVLLGLAGVAILRGDDADLSSAQSIGIALCLGAALCYGFSGLWGRRRLKDVPPLMSSVGQLLCSSAVLIPLALVVDRPWMGAMPGAATWLALLGLGLFATALAYLLFFRILARSGATNVMLVTLLMPVSAIVLGHVALGEVLGVREVVGALVIASALLVIDGRVFGLVLRRLNP